MRLAQTTITLLLVSTSAIAIPIGSQVPLVPRAKSIDAQFQDINTHLQKREVQHTLREYGSLMIPTTIFSVVGLSAAFCAYKPAACEYVEKIKSAAPSPARSPDVLNVDPEKAWPLGLENVQEVLRTKPGGNPESDSLLSKPHPEAEWESLTVPARPANTIHIHHRPLTSFDFDSDGKPLSPANLLPISRIALREKAHARPKNNARGKNSPPYINGSVYHSARPSMASSVSPGSSPTSSINSPRKSSA